MPDGQCDIEHIRNDVWKCTTCCKDGAQGAMCGCDEITDKNSFLRCQGELCNDGPGDNSDDADNGGPHAGTADEYRYCEPRGTLGRWVRLEHHW